MKIREERVSVSWNVGRHKSMLHLLGGIKGLE